MTIIVNLFGAPCSGKSTTRADVFRRLKGYGINCEETYETAKKFTWARRDKELTCQPYIFAKQLRDLEVLVGQVDVIVTDAPLFLGRYYTEKYCGDKYPDSFLELVTEQFKLMGGLNYFLERDAPYQSEGRNQTEEEANQVSVELLELLDMCEIKYRTLKGNSDAAESIVDDVLRKLHRNVQKHADKPVAAGMFRKGKF